MEEANGLPSQEEHLSPIPTLVKGTVEKTYPIGTGAWSATSRKITSLDPLHAFKSGEWVPFMSTKGEVCFRLEFPKPVQLVSVLISGNAWTSRRPPGHPIALYDENMELLGEIVVSSNEDINTYMEIKLEPQRKPHTIGKVFFLQEKHDLCVLRNYHVVARTFQPNIPEGTLLRDVRSLFNNKELSDLTIMVEGKPIYCNRALLAARSTVLRAMLYGSMKESQQTTIEIPETRHDVFLRLLEHIYTDEVPSDLDSDTYLELIVLGEQYNLMRLKAICGVKLKQNICVEKVPNLLITAHRYNSEHLKDLCIRYIVEHCHEVVSHQNFKLLTQEPELLLEVTIQISRESAAKSQVHVAKQ